MVERLPIQPLEPPTRQSFLSFCITRICLAMGAIAIRPMMRRFVLHHDVPAAPLCLTREGPVSHAHRAFVLSGSLFPEP